MARNNTLFSSAYDSSLMILWDCINESHCTLISPKLKVLMNDWAFWAFRDMKRPSVGHLIRTYLAI